MAMRDRANVNRDLVGFYDDYGISDCGVLRCEAYCGFALRRCFDIEVAESLPKRREEFGGEVHHTNFTPCTSSRGPLVAPANTFSWSLYFPSAPRTARSSAGVGTGFSMKCTPASSTPWWTIALSV